MPNIVAYVRHFYVKKIIKYFPLLNIYGKGKVMKKFWLSLLRSDGQVSSKRFITIMAFLIIAIGFIGNMIWKFTIDATIFDNLTYVVLGGLGFTASEKFGKKDTVIPPEEPVEENK